MDRKNKRYQKMESIVTVALCIDAAVFLLYLIFAGVGISGLRVAAAVICILISGLLLAFLYMTRELLRKRSFWMTLAALSIIVCTMFSLLVRFPAPPYVLP